MGMELPGRVTRAVAGWRAARGEGVEEGAMRSTVMSAVLVEEVRVARVLRTMTD